MDEAMMAYYTAIEDYKNALAFQNEVIKKRTKYDASNVSSNLNFLERKNWEEKAKLELEIEKNRRVFLSVLVVLFAMLTFILFKFEQVNRQKRILTENENTRMRDDIAQLTKELSEKGEGKLNLTQHSLTVLQVEIVNLVKTSKTNKEIGEALFISENTVKYHLKSIYEILKIESRSGLK